MTAVRFPPHAPTARSVQSLLAKYLDVERRRVVPTARLEDLGASPLALVQVALAIEEQFEIDVDDHDVGGFETVEDVMAYVAHARERRRRAP